MTDIPSNHPRYHSLRLRERLTEGLRAGFASEAGLIAHGRGEAFDYLLGERTHDFADEAVGAASALLVTAVHPVVSVNGSAASLAGPEILELVRSYDRLVVEVNLFHHSPERSRRIADYLRGLGVPTVVESVSPESQALPQVQHARRYMHPEGIARADVVLVALEDGDRCQALVESGRRVIAVDLNPLSRTARVAQVSIVDELTRALPLLKSRLEADRHRPAEELADRVAAYDNAAVLDRAVAAIRRGA
jgi:4-phosphopantoate--beta-alanine ligase